MPELTVGKVTFGPAGNKPSKVPRLTPSQKATILGDSTPACRAARIRASNHLLVWLSDHSHTIGEANAMEVMNLANAILKGQNFSITPAQP